MRILMLLIALSVTAIAQEQMTEQKINISVRDKAYMFTDYPFPELELRTIDKETTKVELEMPLTLVEVWSVCCGGDAETWAQIRKIEAKYRERGMDTISINFENGVTGFYQPIRVRDHLRDKTLPERLYLDPMGVAVDLLDVTGFPCYFLVNEDHKVVFKTSGRDVEGMRMLLEEIETRLNLLESGK